MCFSPDGKELTMQDFIKDLSPMDKKDTQKMKCELTEIPSFEELQRRKQLKKQKETSLSPQDKNVNSPNTKNKYAVSEIPSFEEIQRRRSLKNQSAMLNSPNSDDFDMLNNKGKKSMEAFSPEIPIFEISDENLFEPRNDIFESTDIFSKDRYVDTKVSNEKVISIQNINENQSSTIDNNISKKPLK